MGDTMKIVMMCLVFICVLFMSIGYASLNTELTISGDAVVKAPTGIKITNISLLSSEGGAYATYIPTFTDSMSNISASLPNQDSKITFTVEITNYSDVYYHLNEVRENSNDNSNITYEIKDEEIIYLPGNSTVEVEISFYYINSITSATDISLSSVYMFKDILYQKLEFIESDGGQYIETELYNTGNYIFEDEFLITNLGIGNNTGSWIVGGRVNPNYSLGVFVNSSPQVIAAYGTITQVMSPGVVINEWYEMYFSMDRLTIGGVDYNLTGEKLIPEAYQAEIIIGGNLLAYDGVSVDNRNMQGKRKYFKVTNAADGTVLRYFVPAKLDSTGEVGMWELVEDKFYGNDGTGVFLAP